MERKAKYIRIALAMAGVSVNPVTADLIAELYSSLTKKKENFTVQDAAEIEEKIRRKYQSKASSQPKKSAVIKNI
jgi:hypothetical protein